MSDTNAAAIELMDPYIQKKINKLTDEEKELFDNAIEKEIRTYGMAIFLAFFSLHYLYINASSFKNWILQGLYLGTTGGCGIWLIIDLIRMKKILGKNYTEKADKIIHKIQ